MDLFVFLHKFEMRENVIKDPENLFSQPVSVSVMEHVALENVSVS